MFSVKEKQYIATEVEKLLLSLKHPEMPKEKPLFHLRVQGKQAWSWADIDPNWKFDKDNPPGVNPFNEISRHCMSDQHKHARRLAVEFIKILDRPMILPNDLFQAEKKCENALCIIRSLRLEATGQPKPKVGD